MCQSIGGAVAIDFAYRNPKLLSLSPLTNLYRHVVQRLTVATNYNHTEITALVHVLSAAHPDSNALARPILIPLPSEAGIISQGKTPPATLKTVFESGGVLYSFGDVFKAAFAQTRRLRSFELALSG
jgi:hypothetical protein